MYIPFVTFLCGYFNIICHKNTHASTQNTHGKAGHNSREATQGMHEVTKDRCIKSILGNILL